MTNLVMKYAPIILVVLIIVYFLTSQSGLWPIDDLSDTLIATSSFVVSAALLVLLRRRTDVGFRWLFGCFIAFIVASGTSHALHLLISGQTAYPLQGLANAVTAVFAAAAVVSLWPVLPRVARALDPVNADKANHALEAEISTLRASERTLLEAQEDLKRRVDEGTRTLADATARLEAACQSKSRFMASVNHEIRTPMNAVLGFADLLGETELNEAQRRYVAIVQGSGRQLLTLLNDILDVAEFEAGKLALERVDFALAPVLEQVRAVCAPQAAERGLELIVEAAVPTSLVLRGDGRRLCQVLVGLVGNMLKFTTAGGIALRVASRPGAVQRLRFEIVDSGNGRAPEHRNGSIRAFAQADGATMWSHGGAGLGLALCKTLVEAMGGAIGLESDPGGGSRLWFELPLERGDAAADGGTVPAQIRPLEVLVVDDVAANRELLGEVLGGRGHHVRMAEDGAAALAAVRERAPDIVLMDIQMPVMDGVEATRCIRRLPGPAGRVPILALTANLSDPDRERYHASGMDSCLAKPVPWPKLFATMAAVAAGDRPRDAASIAD